MATDLLDYKNPTYDDIAKRFLSKKSILAWILKRVATRTLAPPRDA